jgi:hypothetical protein
MAAEDPHFEAFGNGLHVGDSAARGQLEDLDEGTVAMDSLWSTGLAVLEFGSFT